MRRPLPSGHKKAGRTRSPKRVRPTVPSRLKAMLHVVLLILVSEVTQSLCGVLPKGVPDDVRSTRRPFCPLIVGFVCIPLYSVVHGRSGRSGVKSCRIGRRQRLRADLQVGLGVNGGLSGDARLAPKTGKPYLNRLFKYVILPATAPLGRSLRCEILAESPIRRRSRALISTEMRSFRRQST